MSKHLYNADFKKYYDISQKRNIWVLGYFGGGAVNIQDAYQVGVDYAIKTDVMFNTVVIDEITSSRRFKGFKIVYSTTIQPPDPEAKQMENVYEWLRN